MNRKFLFLIFLFSSGIFSQNSDTFSGLVTNKETGEPLPFTSISLKNHPIGTISNEYGKFDFYIPKSKRKDTIIFSYIGFDSYELPVPFVSGKIEVQLKPGNEVLHEVVLSNLSPLDYIKKALENLEVNYPEDPYGSVAYYREKFVENGKIINKNEGVFKSYYPAINDSLENQHQLVLYRPAENPQQFQFMREWFEKKQEKRRKRAITKGEDFEEEDSQPEMDINFGGPESVIDLDIKNGKEKGNYLKPTNFKKYEYTFGERTSLNGESLITINFKARKKIDYQKDWGKILIHKESFAIVLIEQSGIFSMPFIIKPILFAVGLKIGNPTYSRVIRYQKYDDKWYPKLFRRDAHIKLTKRHSLEADENSDIYIGQVFSINRVDTLAVPIPNENRFNTNAEMKDQVFKVPDLQWKEINTVRD